MKGKSIKSPRTPRGKIRMTSPGQTPRAQTSKAGSVNPTIRPGRKPPTKPPA